MKKTFRTMIALGALPLLCMMACSKKPTVEVDNETQSAIDNAIVDQEFMVIVPAVHATYKRAFGYTFSSFPRCDSLVLQSGDTLYGTSGHVDPVYTITNAECNYTLKDSRIRTGKIQVRLTGPLRSSNSNMIIKLQDYRSDGISYSCDSIVATVLSVEANITRFKVRLVNGICQSSAFTIKFAYDNRTFINNLDFYQPFLSVFGTANGVTRDSRAFSVNIPEGTPLVKYRSCPFISGGVVEITPDGFKTRKVDFGDGGCDDDATFSVNGNTLAFKLK